MDSESSFEDPIVSQFLQSVGGDEDLARQLDTWCNERCEIFKGHLPDGEHLLEFTELHNQYVEQWESLLEAFLLNMNIRATDLASRLMRWRRRNGFGQRWVPAFVEDVEYQAFYESMVMRADGQVLEHALAWQQGESARVAGEDFSGVYHIDLSRTTDLAEIDRVGGLAGAPASFRKLYLRVLGRMRIVLNHQGEILQLQFKLPLFSSRPEMFIFDSVEREKSVPFLGGRRFATSWKEGATLRTIYRLAPNSGDGGDMFDLFTDVADADRIYLRQTSLFTGGGTGETTYCFARDT